MELYSIYIHIVFVLLFLFTFYFNKLNLKNIK